MTQANVIEFSRPELPARARIADLLNKAVFGLLLFLVVIAAIPYGTVEPWWKAFFVCLVFVIAIVAIIERLLAGVTEVAGASVLAPMLALSLFALLQTISIRRSDSWAAISADPYQTRFVVLQLLALTAVLALLFRYVNTLARLKVLIYVILSVAVASALYGILRQTIQRSPGFGLPLVKPGQGYGQFINKNHFAYLMEMALGLGLGLIVGGGLKRDRVLTVVALLLPIWTALVLSNSRGGILAMLVQVVVAALLTLSFAKRSQVESARLYRVARSKGVRAALIVMLLLAVMFGVLWVGGDRLLSSFDSVNNEFNPTANGLNEGATRNEIWRASWKMFKAHPFLGVGLGGYWIAVTSYHEASGTLTPQEAHNDYLELLTSGGIVGFAIGVWFAIAVFRKIRRQIVDENNFRRAVCLAALIGISGVAVHSLVDFGLHMLANSLVLIVLIMMATGEFRSRKQVVRR